MAHRFLIIAIILSVAPYADGQELKIGAIVDTDPSMIAIEGQRYRFRTDFNYDGVPDIAVSGDRQEFGKMGGNFGIYLGTRAGKWRYVGSITAHPLAVHVGQEVEFYCYWGVRQTLFRAPWEPLSVPARRTINDSALLP